MKRRHSHIFCFAFIVFMASNSHGLIFPDETSLSRKDWMADVAILVPGTDADYIGLCQGALIDPFWVLTSFGCLYDPYEVIEDVVEGEELEFGVFLGTDNEPYQVAEYFPSQSHGIMLLRMNREAAVDPIAVNFTTAEQLLGQEITIYNDLISDGFYDDFWNPAGDIDASCTVDGSFFQNANAQCYILHYPDRSPNLMSLTGRIIDPEVEGVENHPIDSQVTFNLRDDQLYIDFQSGYPCLEDIGSPIVGTLNGEETLVGLVLATGSTAGLSLCTPTYANFFLAMNASREEFINTTMTEGEFDLVCPDQPRLEDSLSIANVLTLSWDDQANAEGYRLMFTPAAGYIPIEVIELGAVTEYATPIEVGSDNSFALVAFNENCSSVMSDVVTISP